MGATGFSPDNVRSDAEIQALIDATPPLFVIKQADETRVSVDAPVNDSELLLPVSEGIYLFRIVIFLTSHTTPDFYYNTSIPSGATATNRDGAPNSTLPILTVPTPNPETMATSGALQILELCGRLIVGATPGNFIFKWAQASLSVENTTVHKGSFMELWKQ